MEFLRKLFGVQGEDSIREGVTPRSSSSFRCVQINANGKERCAAVIAIRGKRFLPEEIPSLPLPGCDAGACDCSYELFSDRRRVSRREPVETDGRAGIPGGAPLTPGRPD